jgi:hypothetical protein
MFKSIIAKTITVAAAAGLVASLAALSAAAVPQANAEPQASHAKGDRLPMRVTGSACSLRSWPYFDQNCRFDVRRSANEAGTVRLIALR